MYPSTMANENDILGGILVAITTFWKNDVLSRQSHSYIIVDVDF